MRTLLRWGMLMVVCGLGVLTVLAQSEPPSDLQLERDVPVTGEVTEVAFFDLWRFYATAGDRYRLSMIGADGLAPLIGVRDGSGDVFAASNRLGDGTLLEAEPNTEAILVFDVPSDGELVVIATRAGGQDGTTTGAYRLTLTQLEAATPPDPYLDATFRCRSELAQAISYVEFGDVSERGDALRLTVWASFRPVIRVGEGQPIAGQVNCVLPDNSDQRLLRGDVTGSAFPLGEASFDAPTVETLAQTAFFEIPVSTAAGAVGLTIGSLDGLDGVWVARIDGLGLEVAEDVDRFVLRQGTLAQGQVIRLIATAPPETRLDIQLGLLNMVDNVIVCEDWGLPSCEFNDWRSAQIAYNTDTLSFQRLDAVAQVATGKADPIVFLIQSGNPNATGNYTLWLIGGVNSQLP